MLAKEKLISLFSLVFVILTSCTSSHVVATNERNLLTPISTLASATSTPIPICVDEPDVKPDNLAKLEFPNSLTAIESDGDIPTAWDSPQIKDGLIFYIRGIYAINKNVAFIFGGLKVPGGTIGSLLLRSTDGGVHWKEVLNPIDYHDITHVVFIDNGEGWAISTWTMEGELGAKLWHTIDFGETWQESKDYISGINSVAGIRIFDSKHTQIKSLFWWANPNADRYIILDSYDGGISWAESFSIPVNDKNLDSVTEAYTDTPGEQYGNYYQCNMWGNACVAYWQDGSKWQIQNTYSKKCVRKTGISYDRLAYGEIHRTWLENETAIAIPVYFYYRENKIYVKP